MLYNPSSILLKEFLTKLLIIFSLEEKNLLVRTPPLNNNHQLAIISIM
jgi:hypothetical protein